MWSRHIQKRSNGISLFHVCTREAMEKKISDPHGRLVCLPKFTEGQSKETIKHYIQQPSKKGYARAKILLEQYYGTPQSILAAYH